MKDECYEFIKNEIGKANIVGFGSYGEVKIARNTENNQIVAIKLIHGKNAKQEIDVHHKLNHPNIIKLLNYYYEKQKNITYMVLEYAENGSLNQRIKFGLGQLSKEIIRKYFKDICEAITYLHKNNYMHRDLKPENILITKDNRAKLCDFGFAAIFDARTTMCGTFEYMAPEMIKKKHYNYKIDIWALGILLFEMIQGIAPFRGQTGEQVIGEMKKPIKFSQRFDSLEIDLIKKILRVNAENRPTAQEILEHSYFSSLKEEEKSNLIKNNVGIQPQSSRNEQSYSLREKLSFSKVDFNQFLKNNNQLPAKNSPPDADKKKSILFSNHVKQESSFSDSSFMNHSFQTKNSNTSKDQLDFKDRESWKYSKVAIGSLSPQTTKTARLQTELKTEAKDELNKESQNFISHPKKQSFNNGASINIRTEMMKVQKCEKPQNIGFQVKKKTSIVGKIDPVTHQAVGNFPPNFLNKSLKRINSINQASDQLIKTDPKIQAQVKKDQNISTAGNTSKKDVSSMSSSFNFKYSKAISQLQVHNKTLNQFQHSFQTKRNNESFQAWLPANQYNNLQKSVNSVSPHKISNLSLLKQTFK